MGQVLPFGARQVFECAACLHQQIGRLIPLVCDHCGRTNTHCIASVGSETQAVQATDVSLEALERFATGDESLDSALLGGFVRPSTLTAFGVAGVGKSRSTLRWATHLGNCLLVSLEMPLKLAVLSAKEARANLSKLYIIEHEDNWQAEAVRVKAQTVVFDSYQYSQKQRVLRGSKVPLVCHELSEWAKRYQGIGILVAHQNKKGRVSGTTAAEHWPYYLFKFERHGNDSAKIIISKARYSPSGSAIVTI